MLNTFDGDYNASDACCVAGLSDEAFDAAKMAVEGEHPLTISSAGHEAISDAHSAAKVCWVNECRCKAARGAVVFRLRDALELIESEEEE